MTHTMIFRRFFLLLTVIGLGLVACSPATPEPTAEPLTTPIIKPTAADPYPAAGSSAEVDPYPAADDSAVLDPYPAAGSGAVVADPFAPETAATIESLEVVMLTTFPVQAEAIVAGYFPNGCWSLDEVKVEETTTTSFAVTVLGKRSNGDMCTEALVPFEEVVTLPIEGLLSGLYLVEAGNQGTTFTLLKNNTMRDVEVTVEPSDKKGNLQIGEADVENVRIEVDAAGEVATVTVFGSLRDGCTDIFETFISEPAGDTIVITVTTARDPELICTMALVDYEHSFEVELGGISPNDLTLEVNGFVTSLR